MLTPKRHAGFTIVELLIVIVVIGILAAITIVSFNGVTNKAKTAVLNSDLSNTSELIGAYMATNNTYPTSLSQLNDGAGFPASSGDVIGYVADNTASPATYCLVGVNGSITRSLNQNGTYGDTACPGAVSKDQNFCPETSAFSKINGYNCEGTTGSNSRYNNPAVKQLATDSGVPVNAPTYYVAKQTTRDNLIGQTFTVAAGETYCFTGYAATTSSTVTHRIGIMINGSGQGTQWNGIALNPTSTWTKMSGCLTIPSGYTMAQVWTQNDGGDGGTAAPAWYQTGIVMTKQ